MMIRGAAGGPPHSATLYADLEADGSASTATAQPDPTPSKPMRSDGAPEINPFDVRRMLTGDTNRLRYITRHSTSLVLHRENVAEHSYYVAFYAMMVGRWVEYEGRYSKLDTGKMLSMALVHDLDESRTGDFQRPFKHRSEKLKRAIQEASQDEFIECVSGIFVGRDHLVGRLRELWEQAKGNSMEGRIVAFADYLSVVAYLCGETGNANQSIIEDYKTMLEYSDMFSGSEFDFLRPLVEQAVTIVHDIISRAGINRS